MINVKRQSLKMLSCAGVLAAMVSTPAWADWTLDQTLSQLNFISTKNGNIAEVHHFTQLQGTLSDEGVATVEIPLASVETLIPIRNERMQKMLFEVTQFPMATVTAKLDSGFIKKMNEGDLGRVNLDATLSLHGKTQSVGIEASVVKLAGDKLLVTSRKPIIVQAGDFALFKGVEKLREVAGLASISAAVPVDFSVVFTAK